MKYNHWGSRLAEITKLDPLTWSR